MLGSVSMAKNDLLTTKLSLLALILSFFSLLATVGLCFVAYSEFTINKISAEPFFSTKSRQIFDEKSSVYRNEVLSVQNDGGMANIYGIVINSFLVVQKTTPTGYQTASIPIIYYDIKYSLENTTGLISLHFGHDNNLNIYKLSVGAMPDAIYFAFNLKHYVHITYKSRISTSKTTIVLHNNEIIDTYNDINLKLPPLDYRTVNYENFLVYLENNQVFK